MGGVPEVKNTAEQEHSPSLAEQIAAGAIDRKMAINRQRKWNIQADGTGRHVKRTDGEGG